MIMAGRGFAIPFPPITHARHPKPDRRLRPWVTVREALPRLGMPLQMKRAMECGGPQRFGWHVVRDLQPQTEARLRAAVPGGSWRDIDESLRPTCHQGNYVGFTNIYGRMSWDQASPTITAGCTTPAKGRFGHPDGGRTTISVREAALLQTFPQDYVFATDRMDKVCMQIGNAVPPLFAEVIGEQIKASALAHFNLVIKASPSPMR